MMSRDEVLGLSLRRPADINVIRIGSETDGTEGQGVGLEQRNESENSCRKREYGCQPLSLKTILDTRSPRTLSSRHGSWIKYKGHS